MKKYDKDINQQEKSMNMFIRDLPVESKIQWRVGTPMKYGNYLVLHLDSNKRKVIHHDVWFDDGRGWQSKWHDMIAWCAFEDIILTE